MLVLEKTSPFPCGPCRSDKREWWCLYRHAELDSASIDLNTATNKTLYHSQILNPCFPNGRRVQNDGNITPSQTYLLKTPNARGPKASL